MRRSYGLLIVGMALFGVSVLLSTACRPASKEDKGAVQPDFTNRSTIKDLMLGVVDPSADVVWNAVHSTVADAGVLDVKPQNDEEWANVRYGAIRLIEATNLLMIPGRKVAREGERSEAPGVELEPQEMEKLINDDVPGFRKRALALREASIEALQAIEAKDADKVFIVGEHIERACENCHLKYWYPNQVLPPGYEEPPPAQQSSAAAPSKP
jgi:hypothetical protein